MSKKAEEAQASAILPESIISYAKEHAVLSGLVYREGVKYGYEQAEKDLALTPDDIGLINKLLFDMHFEGFDAYSTEKAHERNVDVLRRFNEQRKK